MKKEVGSWVVNGFKSSLDKGYIAKLTCKSCNKTHEFRIKKESDILNLKCTCEGFETSKNNVKYHNGNMRLNSKISRLYDSLKDRGLLSDDFKYYYQFKKCLLDNGYKPWKNVCRINDKEPYSLSNIKVFCSKTSSNSISFVDVRSSSKSCHILESHLMDLKDSYNRFADVLSQFTGNDYISSYDIHRIIRKTDKLRDTLKELEEAFKVLDIEFKD